LMVGLGMMNLAAADTLLLHVADLRLAEHHSQRATGRTSLATERSPQTSHAVCSLATSRR
jgi:hypothetical protein